MTNDKLESARTGNWFQENDLVICRLDKLSRNEDVQAKLAATDWDLIVCRRSPQDVGHLLRREIKYTKRYRLGQLLSGLTRHLLLMTATPHNGKEEDFQLFMALLDPDRFEGRFRDGVHVVDTSDLMRRLIKEQLVKFDGNALFPERLAYTVPYTLSADEARLYKAVTDYVREEFNRADELANGGTRHGRLRPHHAAAASGVFARSDLPIAQTPTRATRKRRQEAMYTRQMAGTEFDRFPACRS